MPPTPTIEFPVRPVTMTVDDPTGVVYRMAEHMLHYTSVGEGVARVVLMEGPFGARLVFLSEVTVDLPGQLEGITDPTRNYAKFRQSTESDVIGAGISSYPWPIPVIQRYLGPNGAGDVHLEALSDDNGNVMTLMQVSDAGLFLRYSGAWQELADVDTIADWGAVEVADTALPLYDAFDQSGQTASLFSMPVKDLADLAPYRGETAVAADQTGVAGSFIVTVEPEPEPPPTLPMPTINSIRDVPGAVETALADPAHRWYVERRLKALGIDYELPWRES